MTFSRFGKLSLRPSAGIAAVNRLFSIALALALLSCGHAATLQQSFQDPPASAKPWTYWFWMNGNITKEGITADLEAMQRVGIGGVLIMEVANPRSMAPAGPVPFASPAWRELFRHVIAECRRLGMQVNMNNDAGWCGSGGPWVPPELSMQKLVSTSTSVKGSGRIEQSLPQPTALYNYYRDVKVLAMPAEGQASIATKDVLDLSEKMDESGRLIWDAPQGEWTILRVGVTTTGVMNKPAPVSGLGLECDKFSVEAITHHYKALIGKLAKENKKDLGTTFTLTHIDSWEVGDQDWTPKMAQEFRKRRGYDVTPWLPVIAAKQTIESPEMTERFMRDFTRTRAELNVEAYAGGLKAAARKDGLKLSIEAYNGKGFLNTLTYGAMADLPMAEFWIVRWDAWHLLSPRLLASVGHVHNKPVIGAESFTSMPPADPWSEHPYSVKALGDWAFCEGVNQFVFHRTVMDPWTNKVPGMTFAGFGWHVDRNQTWFEQGAAYMRYLWRCQALLQQGRFIADIVRLVPAGEDFGDPPNMKLLPGQYDPIPTGFNYDYCSDEALLSEFRVKNGRLVTRSGMSYRALQCPNDRKLTPELLRKIRDFVRAGAVVMGPKTLTSPSLENYPDCDQQVRRFADEIWGNCDGESVKRNRFGKGLAIWGEPLDEALNSLGTPPDFSFVTNPGMTLQSITSVTHPDPAKGPNQQPLHMPTPGMNWIHRRIGNAEVYFVANPQHREVNALCTFRVKGMKPEIWNPLTGEVRDAVVFRSHESGTIVPLRLDHAGSVFVVFRSEADPALQITEIKSGDSLLFGAGQSAPEALPVFRAMGASINASGKPGKYELAFANGRRRTFDVREGTFDNVLSTPWTVKFQQGRGAPETAKFPQLTDWAQHADEGVRYFSGTAVYSTAFEWNGKRELTRWLLDLGGVQVIVNVQLNGKELGTLWKPPFQLDVTDALKAGKNHLEVKVSNLWPNRLIGDEQFPDDYTPDGSWKAGPLPAWPEWYLKGEPRPEQRRVTFTTWKYYNKDSALKPSGLIGPVRMVAEPLATVQ